MALPLLQNGSGNEGVPEVTEMKRFRDRVEDFRRMNAKQSCQSNILSEPISGHRDVPMSCPIST